MRTILRVVVAIVVLCMAPLSALADWRDDVKVLRIGYVSSPDPARDAARLEPFRAYMQQQLSLPVEMIPATSTSVLIGAIGSSRVSYAVMSAGGYITAAAECACVEPVAVPAAFDGSTGFHALLLARADGDIQSLADTTGARLALSADDSLAGRLIPLKAFAALGIDPATHFAALYKSDGPQAAIQALLDGRADLAVAWSSLAGDRAAGYSFGILADMVQAGTLTMDQVRVIWQSPLIPFGPHVVRSDMPPELKTLILNALTGMVTADTDALDAIDPAPYGGGGFVKIGASDYGAVAALVAPPGG